MNDISSTIVTPSGIVETDGYIGKCNCSGTVNRKFKKDKYIIYFLPKRREFHIKEGNNYLVKNQPLSTLCSKLKSLGFPDCVEYSATS